MKLISTIKVLTLSLLSLNVFAQQNQVRMFAANEEKTVLRVLVNGFDWKTVQTPEGEAKVITLEGGTQMNKAGAADLPMLTVMVPAPEGFNLIATPSFNRGDFGNTVFENMTVALLPGIAEPKDKYELRFGDGFSPWEPVKMHKPILVDGKRMVMLNIFPVQYNAGLKKIRLINEIIITIENYEPPQKNSSALAIQETNISALNVYPNPASGIMNISYELQSQSTVAVDIYNAAGQTVYSKTIENQQACLQTMPVDVSEFSAGIYSLVLKTDKGNMFQRIIVE